MVDIVLNHAKTLKQILTDFVFEAEGELAVSLEKFSAQEIFSAKYPDLSQTKLLVDRFIVDGRVGDQSPIDLFLAHQPQLSKSDRHLVSSWKNSIIGLFSVTQIFEDGFELINQTTAKRYRVKPNDTQTLASMKRYQIGEILLVQIAPVTEDYWMFSSPYTTLGRLGKPKLAVAIGNFRQVYGNYLYSDAPELLEQAWQSVEKYHQEFVDFFGDDNVTLAGYQLSQKLTEFQEAITQKQIQSSGFDRNQFLEELADDAELLPEEVKTAVEQTNQSKSMIRPQIDLPNRLKTKQQVTALSHPHWGQMFLTNYDQLETLLKSNDSHNSAEAHKIIRDYLESKEINSFIFYRLAQRYPQELELRLAELLERPGFNLERDLNNLMQEYHKPLVPQLPEIASVPQHLHLLFQEAFLEVNQSKSKTKVTKRRSNKGFAKLIN